MRQKELSDLVERLREETIENQENEDFVKSLRSSFRFAPGFKERIMNSLPELPVYSIFDDLTYRINSLTMKIAFTGVAAIIILAISIFLSWGNVSVDSILGVGNTYDESMISLLTGY